MTKSVDIEAVHEILKGEFFANPMPIIDVIQAQNGSPYQILTATIMSARTKDDVTAQASRKLFEAAPTLEDLKKLSTDELEQLIYPVVFYRQKAKYLAKLPSVVEEKYSGTIPDTVEELCELPGVGRKTANLVVALAFEKPAICVDVHVHRICNRLGYIKTEDPLETEMKLREILAEEFWTTINAYMVSFGQFTCRPTNPFCSRCPIKEHCNQIGVEKSR